MSVKLLLGKEVDLSVVEAYVTIYKPIAGYKAVLLSKDEDCGGMHTPWNTGMWAFNKRVEAIGDAMSWADAEELPFYLADPTEEEMIEIKKFADPEEDNKDALSACFPCNRPTCHECPEQKGGK